MSSQDAQSLIETLNRQLDSFKAEQNTIRIADSTKVDLRLTEIKAKLDEIYTLLTKLSEKPPKAAKSAPNTNNALAPSESDKLPSAAVKTTPANIAVYFKTRYAEDETFRKKYGVQHIVDEIAKTPEFAKKKTEATKLAFIGTTLHNTLKASTDPQMQALYKDYCAEHAAYKETQTKTKAPVPLTMETQSPKHSNQ